MKKVAAFFVIVFVLMSSTSWAVRWKKSSSDFGIDEHSTSITARGRAGGLEASRSEDEYPARLEDMSTAQLGESAKRIGKNLRRMEMSRMDIDILREYGRRIDVVGSSWKDPQDLLETFATKTYDRFMWDEGNPREAIRMTKHIWGITLTKTDEIADYESRKAVLEEERERRSKEHYLTGKQEEARKLGIYFSSSESASDIQDKIWKKRSDMERETRERSRRDREKFLIKYGPEALSRADASDIEDCKWWTK